MSDEHSMGTIIEKDGKQGLIKKLPLGDETLDKLNTKNASIHLLHKCHTSGKCQNTVWERS